MFRLINNIPLTSACLSFPPVITRCPWQHRRKGVVEKIQGPHENHHNIPRDQKRDHHHQKTKTCRKTICDQQIKSHCALLVSDFESRLPLQLTYFSRLFRIYSCYFLLYEPAHDISNNLDVTSET